MENFNNSLLLVAKHQMKKRKVNEKQKILISSDENFGAQKFSF